MLGQHHRAVQHAGHAHVVDERLVAERLLGAAEARNRMTDAVRVLCPFAVSVGERGIALQPELFAEERVPSRLGARQLTPPFAASPAV